MVKKCKKKQKIKNSKNQKISGFCHCPPPFGWGCFIPHLLLGGAAWSPPPFGCCCFSFSCLVVLPSFSSFGWRALHPKEEKEDKIHQTGEGKTATPPKRERRPSSTTQQEKKKRTTPPRKEERPSSTTQQKTGDKVAIPKGREGRLHHQTGELGWSLLFGGAGFLLLLWVVQLFPMSSVAWCCLGLLRLWRCFPLLLSGAVWFHPSFWVVLLFFPSPVGWRCLVSSFLGVVFLSFYVVLLGFFALWGGVCCSLSTVLVDFSSSSKVFRRQDSNCFCFVYFFFLLLSIFSLCLDLYFSLFFDRFLQDDTSINHVSLKS